MSESDAIDQGSHTAQSVDSMAWSWLPTGRPLILWEKVVSACVGFGLTVVLVTARMLQPSPFGYGTHQQLGLPPCTSLWLFGVRCPACGMTTSWSLLLRGRIADSFRVNAGGAILCLIAIGTVLVICYYLIAGRWSRRERLSLSYAILLTVALATAVSQWVARVWA
ncbi:MAG: DUF2752 domain-containing protein [Pirellulales bacterium]